jgi:mono/diheme cytochrome c family protein
MKKQFPVLLASLLAIVPPAVSAASAVDALLDEYRAQGAGTFSAEAGRAFWNQAFTPPGAAEPRRCASCHTADPGKTGKHLRTGKPIEPLAPSVNPRSLGDAREIEKWLKRNCEWTVGRICMAQEKGDVLMFLSTPL